MSDQKIAGPENKGRFRGPIIFSIVNLALAAAHILPPNMHILFWEVRYKALARLFHGFLEFAVFVLHLFSGGTSPLRMFIGLSLLGPPVGYIIYRTWKSGSEGKTIVIGCLFINTLFGGVAVDNTSLLVGRPVEHCLTSLDATRHVKVVVFPESGLDPGAHYFFASSTDNGQTWQQVFYLHDAKNLEPPCENFSSLDSHTYWFWMGWAFAITHDGGNTWHVWDPSETWEDWTCCDNNLILNVTFTDQQNGVMELSEFNNPTGSKQLLTEDGGIRWMLPP